MAQNKLQVEVVKNNGDLSFRFLEKEMEQRQIVVENIASHQIAENEKWWAVIVGTEEVKGRKKKGAIIIRLLSKIDRPQLDRIESLDGFWIEPMMLRHIQIYLLNGHSVMLIGHKGTGKTDFAYRLAQAWSCPICKVDCGTLQTPSSLFGAEAAEKGQTVWRPSEFWHFCQSAIQNPGERFILLLDEINRMNAKMAEGLHGLYDQTRQVSVTTSEGTKVVKLPTNLMTIATRNAGHQYTGTYAMDASLSDRLREFHFSLLPETLEVEMLVDRHGIHPAQAGLIVKVANSLRKAERQGVLSASPSPRRTDAAALLVKYGETVADSIESAFLGAFERDAAGFGENGDEETEYLRAKAHVRKFLEKK